MRRSSSCWDSMTTVLTMTLLMLMKMMKPPMKKIHSDDPT
jgi:hypothetical protein